MNSFEEQAPALDALDRIMRSSEEARATLSAHGVTPEALQSFNQYGGQVLRMKALKALAAPTPEK